jgi:hypothetical protein
MAPVIDVTREVLLNRRGEILQALGYDAAEFRNIADSSTLTGEEWRAKEELDAIEFLLGEDPAF